jgi:hypothetical protein
MGMSSEVEALAARAQFMRESMGKSQSITDSMISILGSFDHRLSALETSMRPTQVEILHCFRHAYSWICFSLPFNSLVYHPTKQAMLVRLKRFHVSQISTLESFMKHDAWSRLEGW